MSARKPTLEGRRVLVTGGAGVIGRELIERLTAQGARVLCCDLEPRPAEFGPNVEHVRGAHRDHVDLRVVPPPCPLEISPTDFSRGDELLEAGYSAARAWLDLGAPPVQAEVPLQS